MKKNDSNTSSSILPNKISILHLEIGLKAGPGSLANEKVRGKCCKICKTNGFPHEPIIWREIRKWNEDDKSIDIECVSYDYFKPSARHVHKFRRSVVTV